MAKSKAEMIKAVPLHRSYILIYSTIILLGVISITSLFAQTIDLRVHGFKGKVYLSTVSGEKTSVVDSTLTDDSGQCKFIIAKGKDNKGVYRISFNQNKWLDLIDDNEEVKLSTNINAVLDSLKILKSESNKLFYSFINMNKDYKTKADLLLLILSRFPKDDEYYTFTKKRLANIQNDYIKFVNVAAQKNPKSFAAKYILSAQLPIIDEAIYPANQLNYLKAHALDNVDFKNAALINSDLFSSKAIEYLTYYRNPLLPKEILEKEFMIAVDTLLGRAKINQQVYQHVTQYLIDGFKKFGFDKILDYIVENYVIKDDLCLDIKTEGLIKKRIDQAKFLKVGNIAPNISLLDSSNNIINLNNLRSYKTLIVFYASWCPHCKELLPKLNELRIKSDLNKLNVLAISLDSKREDWTNFIKSNCYALINVSDLKGWDGKAASDYFIYATPTMFLVNADNKIIAKPIAFEMLQDTLTK